MYCPLIGYHTLSAKGLNIISDEVNTEISRTLENNTETEESEFDLEELYKLEADE